jgi:hypothetical protein
MPRENEMPRAKREGPLRTGGGPPTIKMDRSHSLPPPPQMGNGGPPPAHLPSSSLFDHEEWLQLKWSLPPPRAPNWLFDGVHARSERAYTASWGGMDDIWGDARREDERVVDAAMQTHTSDIRSMDDRLLEMDRQMSATENIVNKLVATSTGTAVARIVDDQDVARCLHGRPRPPLKKGNAPVTKPIVDGQNTAHHARPRSPLEAGNVLVNTSDEQDAARHDGLQLLLDEHAASSRREAARRRQLLLDERAARARQEAAANCSLMAKLDSLMAECCSDIAALQAEINLADDRRHEATANAAMSAATGSGATLPSARLRHMMAAKASAAPIANDHRCHEAAASAAATAAAAAAASAAAAAALDNNRRCNKAAVATAASTPSLRPFDAVMMAFKMLDGGSAHPFRCELPHPPRKRTHDRGTRRRVCRRHGPWAPNLLVSLLRGWRHRPCAPNNGGWD